MRGPERRLGGIGRHKFMVPGGQGVISLWAEPRPYFLVGGVKSYPPPGEATGRAAGSEHQVWPSFLGRARVELVLPTPSLALKSRSGAKLQ